MGVSLGLALIIWIGVAMGLGASGLLKQLPMPAPQLILALLTAAVLIAIRVRPGLRQQIGRLSLRRLVLFHTTRLVGFYFLYLYARGRLPYAFAVIGGRGDIAVALSAICVACFSPVTLARRGIYLVWNIFGSIDILFVIFTAARIGFEDGAAMRELTILPLSLLPTFLVPLIIVTHALVFLRLNSLRHEAAAMVNPLPSAGTSR